MGFLYWLVIILFGLLSAFLTLKLQKKIKNSDKVVTLVMLINGGLAIILVGLFMALKLNGLIG
ncbi:hypothetical protein [Anaerobacillus sp. 1_MG-2023]|uniref:hypothetical protein n=1 Tax=Anaerobacillus sp. 1_MG-2023 TaxID=3062655 RepID=UPI0026E28B46|nr:hypothetical protein [Anaerobacillus sp. 1_MG-2023]MDO6657457.1 hypothetical protein [Anaerobacillus sp. 1_MG-2023]